MSSRRPLSLPILLAIGMITLLVVLTVGWSADDRLRGR